MCRRNFHVDPYKIEPCFRTFPKFKQIMPLLLLNTNGRRIMTGHSQNFFILSFFLSFVCMFRPFIGAPPFGVVMLVLIKVTN